MHNGYNNMKRQRGRGRKPGAGGGGGGGHHNNYQNQHPNRAMESSGPEIKVRGPASHIYERYLQLSRDATSAGDRVLGENYAQHADHYFRLVRAMQPAMPPPQPRNFNEGEFEGDDNSNSARQDVQGADDARGGDDEGGDQPDVDFPSGEQQQQQQFNRDRDADPRRRRGRRNRFRPEGGEGEAREGGEPREAREEGGERPPEPRAERQDRGERPERHERQPRERDAEPGGPEGFSSGPKPAFLRDS